MVRITTILRRVPVIKFRKGGIGQPGAPAAAAPSGAPATASHQTETKKTLAANTTASGFMVPRTIMIQYGKQGDVIVFKMLLQKLEGKPLKV